MFSIRCFLNVLLYRMSLIICMNFKNTLVIYFKKKLYQIPTQYQKIDTLHNILIKKMLLESKII